MRELRIQYIRYYVTRHSRMRLHLGWDITLCGIPFVFQALISVEKNIANLERSISNQGMMRGGSSSNNHVRFSHNASSRSTTSLVNEIGGGGDVGKNGTGGKRKKIFNIPKPR